MQEALDAAIAAAEAGGRVVREASMGAVRAKRWTTDLVTEADIASGVAIVSEILRRDPGANILVEEDEVYGIVGISPGRLDGSSVWVIDPIDGTTSFVHGFPAYSISVAYLEHGQPKAGAILNVPLGELFCASEGGGAFCNDEPVRVTDVDRISDALLVTGFPYDRGAPLEMQLAALATFLRAGIHGVRRDGSAAVDCCHVALGRCDGFWEYYLKPWDMAAGVVILREAGAVVTDVAGSGWTPETDSICTANPALHALMLDVLRGASTRS